jgi:hypothetical protein
MAQDRDSTEAVRSNQSAPRVTPLGCPGSKFVLKFFKIAETSKNHRKSSTTPFLTNFMSMEILGCVESISVFKSPSFLYQIWI